MTELIDSLLEFSRTRESLRPAYGSVKNTMDRAVQAIRSHPEFHRVQISVYQEGASSGWFDQRKLERAFFNLLHNACEAVAPDTGRVEAEVKELPQSVEIRVIDNGRGIPELIRDSLFEPFVSQGKENGTGLGLTVVQKIIEDHGGSVAVEKTSEEGTVFRIWLPLRSDPGDSHRAEAEKVGSPELARSKRTPSE